MRNIKIIALGVWLCAWFVALGQAVTFELVDGTKVEGEIVQGKPEFLQIRVGEGQYERIPWEKLSQATLKQLAEDSKFAEFAKAFIEIPEDEKIKQTEVEIKPVPRLERPAKGSVIGAMFGSSVGLVVMLLLYAANIYAGYEIATVRAYPPAMVCGIAAAAPVIGPVIFLCLPTKLKSSTEHQVTAAEAEATATDSSPLAPTPEQAAAGHSAAHGLHLAHEPAPAASTPAAHAPPQIFKRGQFTFNRRFIETKFAGFFGMVRHGAEKDQVLVIKSARGEYTATRISRIAANDLHVDVHAGGASQEVQIPFLEIQEIQIKHKDA